MSIGYISGVNYVKSYSGLLNLAEGVIHIILIICTHFLTDQFESQFLCGISVYGLFSAVLTIAFHVRGVLENVEFPWLWVEFSNSVVLAGLHLISSVLVLIVLTKGYILTGVVGFIITVLYVLDTIDKFNLARMPRARYVWTTPNMPE